MARPALLAAAMCLLLGVQLAGPALHAVAFYAHNGNSADEHHEAPDDHHGGDCKVCQFVAGLTPELPQALPVVALAPNADHFFARASRL